MKGAKEAEEVRYFDAEDAEVLIRVYSADARHFAAYSIASRRILERGYRPALPPARR